eukprot:COSAG02_NODE_64388_length_260_cov_1.354037_1_plen_27_part_10
MEQLMLTFLGHSARCERYQGPVAELQQ